MAGAYDDRDGLIWMDGKLVDWRQANVHILTHAMHYASSVFEGERAYNGKIFESRRHSERLLASGRMLDVDIPWTVDEIEAAKYEVMKANGLTDAYVRAVAWRGSGEDMGVSSAKNPVRLAVAAWEWGSYYGDAKFKGAKLDISKWKRPLAGHDPCPRQGRRALHDLHHVQTRGGGKGLLRCAVHGLPRSRGGGDGRQHLLREGR
jgi:branched-chain amino acid aminotransferase